MPEEAAQPVDTRNNPESRAAESGAPTSVARASAGGPPPRDAPASGDLPEQETGGTADGSPVAGVTISAADEQDAVSADTGPVEIGG
jgi:hypothetical protein